MNKNRGFIVWFKGGAHFLVEATSVARAKAWGLAAAKQRKRYSGLSVVAVHERVWEAKS